MDLKKYIATVENFPKEGIMFRDVTPLIADGEAFNYTTDLFADFCYKRGVTKIVGPEARGFIFGCPVAYELGLGFVPIRKPGKLPRETISYAYDLEYGSNTLCVHADSVKKGQKVIVVDDLLATGGTVEATIKLIEQMGGEVVGCAFLIELVDLKGRELIKNYKVKTLVQY